MKEQKRMFLIKLAYWLGVAADALWAVALLFPLFFGILTGRPDFDPDLQTRLIMGMAGALITGWTFLLVWAVRNPIERRMVILLTAYPVVSGMFMVSLIDIVFGNYFVIWALIKSTLLIVSMTISYILAGRMAREH